jgi:two-component system, chemotaxis family, CheB/CheR fusion protein
MDTNLHVVMANQRFYDTFQISPSDSAQCQIADLGNLQASLNKSQKCQIFDLGNGEWNIPQLRSLLEDLLTHNTQIENFQLTHIFEHLGQKQMRLNACRLSLNNGVQLILLAIKDESDRSHSPERVL